MTLKQYPQGWDRIWRSLPTEPYAAVRVQWADPQVRAARLFMLSEGGNWFSADGVAAEPLHISGYTIVGKAIKPIEFEPDAVHVEPRDLRPLGDGDYRYTGLRRNARTGQWLAPETAADS